MLPKFERISETHGLPMAKELTETRYSTINNVIKPDEINIKNVIQNQREDVR